MKSTRSFALAHARQAEAYAEIELADKAREELLQAMALIPIVRLSNASPCIWTPSRQRSGATSTAIEKYSTIVDSVPDSDKSVAYVDLGRAYEKKETSTKPSSRT